MRADAQKVQRPTPGPRSEIGRISPSLYYLVVEFGRPMAWFPALAPLKLGMIAALAGLLAVIVHKTRRWPRPFFYMLGMLALLAWHVPVAINNRLALWGFQSFAVIFACVLPLALLPRTLRSLRTLLLAFVLLHVPTSIFSLTHGGRGIGGWMGDENDLALALNIALGVGVYLTMTLQRFLPRILMLGALGVMVAGVTASLSRGGFIGLAAVAVCLLVTGPHRKKVAGYLALGVVALLLFAPPSYWDEVRSIQTAAEPGDTGEQRLYLWGMAWRMFLDHPLTGVGTMNYGINAPLYESQERAETTGFHVWGRVAHSTYFTLLSEQGLIGTILFGAILVWCWGAFRRIARRARDSADAEVALLASGLLAGMTAFLVTGLFLSVLYYPLFWVLVAFLSALDAIVEERARTAA